MNTLEEKILQYGLLSTEEQRALHLDVAAHPRYTSLFDDVKALYQLIAEADTSTPGHKDELMAYLAAQELLGIKSLPQGIAVLDTETDVESDHGALQRLLGSDPDVAQRYTQVRAQMALLLDQQDPVAQFEALAGYKLEQAKPVRRKDRLPRPGIKTVLATSQGKWKLWGSVATLSMVLFVVFSSNGTARLGYLTTAELNATHPSHLRSMIWSNAEVRTPESMARDESYLMAFSDVAQRYARSQQRWFFLHYIYNDAVLMQAERELEGLVGADAMSPELLLEIRYLLAKVYLAGGKTEEARDQLLKVQQHAGFKSGVASKLLDKM